MKRIINNNRTRIHTFAKAACQLEVTPLGLQKFQTRPKKKTKLESNTKKHLIDTYFFPYFCN